MSLRANEYTIAEYPRGKLRGRVALALAESDSYMVSVKMYINQSSRVPCRVVPCAALADL